VDSLATEVVENRPNIVFILTDDLGYGDLGCYGQRHIRTPRIDALAKQGMRFTQAYAGATVCAPSRCVLMTGLHQGHCRVRGNGAGIKQSLRNEDVTVAEVLKEAGYDTGLIGKWGLGDVAGGAEAGLPNRQGFDYFFGYANQMHAHNYYPTFLWRNSERVALRNTVPNEQPSGAGVSDNKLDYSGDLFAAESLDFIRRHQELPFFLYLAVTTPHANNEAKQAGMEVPDLGDYAQRNWPAPRKAHAAMISRMDAAIGRLLALLDELKLADRTVVVFTSDNGSHSEGGYDPAMNQSSGPLRGHKRSPHDGGIRVPLIVRWPGLVPAGSTSDALVYFADMLPTLAAIGGGQSPPDIDGVNFLPTLQSDEQPELNERTLYWEFHEGEFWQAARQGKWKAVHYPQRGVLELYDLNADIAEAHEVAAQHPDVVKRFKRYFSAARTENPDWPMHKSVSPTRKRGNAGGNTQ
jgi:arylsulfatase A-like enzyme